MASLLPWTSASSDDTFTDKTNYRTVVRPLLAKYCVDCHSADQPEADLVILKVDPDLLNGDDLEHWRAIREQFYFHDMPPEEATQPTDQERKLVLGWIQQELLKTQLPGVVTQEKLLLPQYGNYVDHQALFDERRTHVTPAPPRIWRLRPEIYRSIVPRLGDRISGLSNALTSADGSEFKDFSAPYFLDEASTQQLFANAKLIAAKLVGDNAQDRDLHRLASPTVSPQSDVVSAAIETTFRRALLRGPTVEEKTRFAKLHAESLQIGGPDVAARALLTAILMQPEFLFRQELGAGEPDSHGRVRLSPREIAFAISFSLGDAPLKDFLDLADKAQLSTSKQVAAAVRCQLTDDSLAHENSPRLMQFFREYFNYPFATEVFKDQPEGGEHKASALVADLELTIKSILREDRQVLRRLLTTREYFVNVAYSNKRETLGKMMRRDTKTRRYQTAFNLPLDWKWSTHLQPVAFRADERAGVLTHPAWLAAWSGNFDNHPVQRGQWIRTHLLGGTVPDVPIGVDARVPEKEHTTFRDRLQSVTTAAECWRCHKKMDPLGLPFERYDHYGRLQRSDAGQPVNVTGEISRTMVAGLNQPVSDPTQLMHILANSEHVEQVFIRYAFRYFMGRNETLGDANTLQDAHRVYRETNGSFIELVISLLSSDSFLLRQATTDIAALH